MHVIIIFETLGFIKSVAYAVTQLPKMTTRNPANAPYDLFPPWTPPPEFATTTTATEAASDSMAEYLRLHYELPYNPRGFMDCQNKTLLEYMDLGRFDTTGRVMYYASCHTYLY